MATDRPVHVEAVPRKRLWFGLTTAAVAWLTAGFIDLLIVWHVCGYSAAYGMNRAHCGRARPGFRDYGDAVPDRLGGGHHVVSKLADAFASRASARLQAPRTAREFMALVGVFISVTLGVGIVWLSIPPLLIQLCVRAK